MSAARIASITDNKGPSLVFSGSFVRVYSAEADCRISLRRSAKKSVPTKVARLTRVIVAAQAGEFIEWAGQACHCRPASFRPFLKASCALKRRASWPAITIAALKFGSP